jgi:hypothetical protein
VAGVAFGRYLEFSRRPPSKQARKPAQAKPGQAPTASEARTNDKACGGDESTGSPPPTAIALGHTQPQRRRPIDHIHTITHNHYYCTYSRATSPSLTLSSYRSYDSSTILHLPQKTPFIVQPGPPRILRRCSANHTPEPVSSAHDLIHLHGSVNNHHRQSCRARPP